MEPDTITAPGEYDPMDITQFESRIRETPDEIEGTRLDMDETAPVPEKRRGGLFGRIRGVAKTKTGRPTHPRISVDKTIGTGWRMLAGLIANVNMPVARTLQMQAPVIGELLEPVVRDTVMDAFLQPFARLAGKGETLIAILGPPILVGAMAHNPELVPRLVPQLREALRMWVVVAGKKLEEAAEREEKYQEVDGALVERVMMYLLQDIAAPVEPEPPTDPVAFAPPMPAPPAPVKRPAKKAAKATGPRTVPPIPVRVS